jgi:imidazole glycerol phosphate synthase glutamine amidotransferase subunit
MIVVVDYGMGNLRNVLRAIEKLNHPAQLATSPSHLREASCILLPGVGAFGAAVRRIDSLGFREALWVAVDRGVPLLGICLGMQLLFERSEESPGALGLGLLPGRVVRFSGKVKVPHVGWNDVTPVSPSPLFPDGRGGVFYFVHSFFLPDSPTALAHTFYGQTFASAVGRGGVLGVQFHPEKSQSVGLQLLKNFLDSVAGQGVKSA